ncbi:TIP-1 family-domain-containing protein [Powellomyces hirtus]|nr:TIP-1 family-domain-containing protein [Powellomyces hirtus]
MIASAQSDVEAQVARLLNAQFPTLDSLTGVVQFLTTTQARREALLEEASKQAETAPQKVLGIVAEAKQVHAELKDLQARRTHLVQTLEQLPTDETLLATLSAAQTKLQKLQIAKSYVETLLKIDGLSAKVEQNMARDVTAALDAYDELRLFWRAVHPELAEVAEALGEAEVGLPFPIEGDATKNLVSYVEGVTSNAHASMKSQFARKLEDVLDALDWPKPIALGPNADEKLSAFREAFANLLLLQNPEQRDGAVSGPLSPMEVLLQAPVLHFKYHFQGDRPTNRLDKPEWGFTRVLMTIRDHSVFLCGPVQLLLDEYGFASRDAKNEFIHGLLVAVMHKLRIDAPKLLLEPRLFSHAVKETLAFDKSLREVHLYVQPKGNWKGCASIFTEKTEWFQQWIAMELAASQSKFAEAIEADEAWEFADEAITESDELRPTQSAELFVKILEAITDRYKLLPEFAHRISFFNELQLPLLEDYLQEVRSGIKKHVSAFHPINTPGAMIPNKSGRLQMLCRYASSLHYIASTLQEWGDQPFFVDFWEEIRERADGDEAGINATVFDEAIVAYEKGVKRLQDVIIQDVMQEFTESMWQYDRRRNWVIASHSSLDDSAPHLEEISPELCSSLDALSRFIPNLRTNLPHSLFQHVLRDLAFRIDEHLFTRVVLRGRFNSAGAQQLQFDITSGLFSGLFRRWHPKPAALFRRLNESLILLTLPMNPPKHHPSALSLVTLVEGLLDGDEKAVRANLEKAHVYRLTTPEVQDVVNRLFEVESLFSQILQDD